MKQLQFISNKKIWFSFSTVLVLISLYGILGVGLDYGIEFKGGTSLDIQIGKQVQVEEMRTFLEENGVEESIIQPVGDDQMLVRVPALSPQEESEIRKKISAEFGIDGKKNVSIETVGPAWGEFITDRAVLAFAVSMLALLVYISLRFEYKMAVSVIVALFHDLIITFGVYALVRRQVTPNTIAAILTIMGYSLYDTIVVFHRIKENEVQVVRQTYSMMANTAINQVMMRSVNTSLATLLPILALLLVGGETLKDFAFALLVGISTGAYSSIFLASPFLAWWKEFEPRYVAVRRRVQQETLLTGGGSAGGSASGSASESGNKSAGSKKKS